MRKGTQCYMAPEIFEAATSGTGYTFNVDFWALGLIVFECHTGGRMPFCENNINQMRLDIMSPRNFPITDTLGDEVAENFVKIALKKNPRIRWGWRGSQ